MQTVLKWLQRRWLRLIGILGLIHLWVLDVAVKGYITEVRNGFWTMDGEKAFHIALFAAAGACIAAILNENGGHDD